MLISISLSYQSKGSSSDLPYRRSVPSFNSLFLAVDNDNVLEIRVAKPLTKFTKHRLEFLALEAFIVDKAHRGKMDEEF